MPKLTRWFIKSALIFFVFALLVRLVQATSSLWELPVFFGALGPVYFHMFLVGWVTQLIFGVIYWMFPKFSTEKPRGSERLGWITFWLLNIGLIFRMVGEPLNVEFPTSGWGWSLVISAILQWLAGMAFISNTWVRVREK